MTGRWHVLKVGEELDLLESVARLLKTEGFRVSTNDDPRITVATLCDRLSPNLFMLDYRMPWLNGSQAHLQMRECGVTAPAIPVSAMASLAA
jgi:FixJ family two-component response regulator